MAISTDILNESVKMNFCKYLGIEDYEIEPYSQSQPHLNKKEAEERHSFLGKSKEVEKMFYPFRVSFKFENKWNYFYIEADTVETNYSVPFARGTNVNYDIQSMEQKALKIIKDFCNANR